MNNGTGEPSVLTSLRQDYADPDHRYLMVMNLLPHPRRLKVDRQGRWNVAREFFHDLRIEDSNDQQFIQLAPKEVYLFELIRQAGKMLPGRHDFAARRTSER